MKLLLISLNQQDVDEFKKAPTDISALSARYLSSYLKSFGHEVDILFLCKYFGKKEDENEIIQIIELIDKLQPDLIGISLMSNHFFRAVTITQAIKQSGNYPPIIWGGIHPTIDTIKCLEFADFVCKGEGEIVVKMLLDNFNNFRDLVIPGIWYKNGDKIVDGGHGQLISDINSLPHPDYNFNTQYIIHKGKLIPLSIEIFRQYFPAIRGHHRVMSGRGCPHNCSYCCSPVFKGLYGHGYMRQRSVDNFMAEMVEIKNKFPFIVFFKIMDDTFASNSVDWLREFNKQYKQKINLPFYCLVSPTTITEEKLDLLVDAGLKEIQIGLQSGSNRLNSEVYLRHAKVEHFLKMMEIFEKYRGRIDFSVDVIVDNPYETKDDLLQTINVLNQIKKPFKLSIFSLSLYAGTSLHQRAINDKLLADENEYLSKQFHLLKNNIFNKIIYLTPRLSKQQINKIIKNYNNFFIRCYINILYFVYTKKRKLPPPLLKLISRILKYIKTIHYRASHLLLSKV